MIATIKLLNISIPSHVTILDVCSVCGVFIEIGMDGYKPNFVINYLSSVQFSCSVVSDSVTP